MVLINCSYLACCDEFLYACRRCQYFSYAAVVDIILVMCCVMVCAIVDRSSSNAADKVTSIVSTIAC